MEQFFANPGFAHIAEEIMSHLDHRTLLSCRLVSISFKNILDNPKIWLRRCKRVSMSDEKESKWRKVIDSLNNTDGINFDKLLNQVTLYLMKMSKSFYNVHSPIHCAAKEGNIELLKLALEVMKNDKSNQYLQDDDKSENKFTTPMHLAAEYGHLEVVKFLEPYMKFPKRHLKITLSPPIFQAIIHGHAEIVQYFAQEDPIQPERRVCQTLFDLAIENVQLEVLKVLFGTLGVPQVHDLHRLRNDFFNRCFLLSQPDYSAKLKKICKYITGLIEQQVRIERLPKI